MDTPSQRGPQQGGVIPCVLCMWSHTLQVLIDTLVSFQTCYALFMSYPHVRPCE